MFSTLKMTANENHSLLEEYKKIGITNLKRTSRTASEGTIDVSAADDYIPEICLTVLKQFGFNNIPPICEENFEQFNFNEEQFNARIQSNEKISSLNIQVLKNKKKEAIKELVVSNYKQAIEAAYQVAKKYCL